MRLCGAGFAEQLAFAGLRKLRPTAATDVYVRLRQQLHWIRCFDSRRDVSIYRLPCRFVFVFTQRRRYQFGRIRPIQVAAAVSLEQRQSDGPTTTA